MNNFQAFNPSTTGQLIMGSVFYLFIAVVMIMSIATIFVFLKRTNEKTLTLAVIFLYTTIFLATVGQGINSLMDIT